MRAALTALAAAAIAWPACAHDDPPIEDVRCLVVATAIAGADSKNEAILFGVAVYFYGKINGRGSSMNLEDELIRQLKSMSVDDIRSEGMRCGREMEEQGAALKSIGARIQARATEQTP